MKICFSLIFLTGIINRLHKSYLLKEGRQTHLNFFRPIIILSYLSKLFTAILNHSLNKFSNNFLI